MQAFDSTGKFLTEWKAPSELTPYGVNAVSTAETDIVFFTSGVSGSDSYTLILAPIPNSCEANPGAMQPLVRWTVSRQGWGHSLEVDPVTHDLYVGGLGASKAPQKLSRTAAKPTITPKNGQCTTTAPPLLPEVRSNFIGLTCCVCLLALSSFPADNSVV